MRIPTLFILFSLLCVLAAPVHAEGKVGFIEVRRIVDESSIGKLARQDVDRLQAEREKALQRSMDAINGMERQVNEDMTLAPEKRRELIEALRKQYQSHERLVADVHEELEQEEVKLLAFVLKRIKKTLDAVAKRKGYTIIIRDPEAVGYVDATADITDDVLKELDGQ